MPTITSMKIHVQVLSILEVIVIYVKKNLNTETKLFLIKNVQP